MPDLQRKMELKTAALSQVLHQMADGGIPEEDGCISNSGMSEMMHKELHRTCKLIMRAPGKAPAKSCNGRHSRW
ncbi:hypothetical protein WJX84_008671 [Apatococcus fuscideae]|uniref:Uncharacterized protein n=1 Tax=Apatococcus fuscideae TaxID=2026836 RepID=A0AAW1SXG6_9CHLO